MDWEALSPALEVYQEFVKQNINAARPQIMSWTPEHTDFIKFFMVKRAFFNIAHRVEWTKLCFALHLDLPEDCGPELTPEASFLLDQLMSKVLTITKEWVNEGRLEKLMRPLRNGSMFRWMSEEERAAEVLMSVFADCEGFTDATGPFVQQYSGMREANVELKDREGGIKALKNVLADCKRLELTDAVVPYLQKWLGEIGEDLAPNSS